jgi:hypothetical protein
VMRGHSALMLAFALLGAGCARASTTRGAAEAGAPRTIPLGFGIALPAGEAIRKLPPEQRYRFVSPDSLVRGATDEDVASVRQLSALRANVAVVLHGHRWRESSDSAEYDIVVFVAERTFTRTEVREEPVVSSEASGLPFCEKPGGNQPRCTTDRNARTRQVRVSVPFPVRRHYHIIRRRSDGAVVYWVQQEPLGETSVLADLVKLFLTQEG